MKCQAQGEVARDGDPVGDLYSSLDPVEGDAALMDRLSGLTPIAPMSGAPLRQPAALQPAGAEQLRLRRIEPKERAAVACLVEAADLQRVMPDGGTEIAPELRLGQIAIGAGVRKYVDAASPTDRASAWAWAAMER
jgi:hypothetical protein